MPEFALLLWKSAGLIRAGFGKWAIFCSLYPEANYFIHYF